MDDFFSFYSSFSPSARYHRKKHPPSQSRGQQPHRRQSGNEEEESASAFADIFQAFRGELDSKYDRHERIVKLSRDVTIQSKRVIFLLHRITSDSDRTKLLAEADGKICEICTLLRSIALELKDEDPYLHHRAYLPGVQEFIEALSYLEYIRNGTLISLDDAQCYLVSPFTLPTKTPEENAQSEKVDTNKEETVEEGGGGGSGLMAVKEVTLPLHPTDYVLGIADLTGEMMRMSINAVGSGNRDLPFRILPFVRAIHCAMQRLTPNTHVNRKLTVLKASLVKIEQTCYTLRIRGSEIPKHMLMHAINTSAQAAPMDEDLTYDCDGD